MLEVLRSLTPPKSAPPPVGPREGEPPPHAAEDAPRAGETPSSLPSRPAASPVDADGRVIRFRMEEVGVFFLAAVVLVVMAFLMGWYGRGRGGASPRPDAVDSTGRAARPTARAAEPPVDSSPGRDLGARPGAVTSAPPRSGARYSILVAKFPREAAGEAEDHSMFLKQRGYPARMRLTAEGIELCVGKFDSPADGLARQWLPKLKALGPAYSSARVVKLP